MNSKIKIFTFKNDRYRFAFYFFLIVNIFLSINSGIYHIQRFEFTDSLINNFFSILNVYRYLIIYLIIVITSFITILSKSKINIESKIFIIYLTVQFLCLFIYERDQKILDVHSPQIFDSVALLLASISSLLIINLVKTESKKRFIEFFFIFLIFFFLISSSYFLIELYLESFGNKNNDYLYSSSTLNPIGNHFGQPNPRVTGLSRVVLILFILSLTLSFYKKNINKISQYICYLFCFICCFNMWALQSRGALLGLIIFLLIFLIFFNVKFLKKIFTIFFLFILPILIYEQVYKPNLEIVRSFFSKTEIINKLGDQHFKEIEGKKRSLLPDKDLINESLSSNKSISKDEIYSKDIVLKNFNEYSSGRFQIWESCFKILIKNKYIIGFGPQADRYLITKYLKNDLHASWGNNSSNAILYSLLSGGIIGLLFISFIYFKSIKLLILCLFKFKDVFKGTNVYLTTSFCILSFVLFRSLFENSFLVFGIDFFLFIISYFYIKLTLKIA